MMWLKWCRATAFAAGLVLAGAASSSAQGFPAQVGWPMAVSTGAIAGRVISADTRMPLSGVEVTLLELSLVVLTDEAGRYRFGDVSVGSYRLLFAHLGFRAQARADVIVRADRVTIADAALEIAPLELPGVTSAPDYFPRARQASGSINFSAEEIRRAPGSAGDVSRMLMGLPSLAKVNDQSNALIVRGGSPFETVFLVDGIEIRNINHFPTQGASGGPIGLLNADLIGDVELHAGAFPALYGDALSGVMDIRLREGSRTAFEAQADLNFAGFGGVLEGPLAHGAGSWLVTARRSYLDLLVKAIDVGTTVAPRFGDAQAKLTLDLNPRHSVSVLAVAADDRNRADLETAIDNAMLQYGRQDIVQATAGVSWSALWSDRLWSLTSVAVSLARFREDFSETATGVPLLLNRSAERELSVRNLNRLALGARSTLEFGLDASALHADYDNAYEARIGPLGQPVAALRLSETADAAKVGTFASLGYGPTPRLRATVGVRADAFTWTDRLMVAPRAALSYRLSERTTLSGATGLYRQTLPLVLLAQRSAHRELRDPAAVHVVAGMEHRLAEDSRLTVEAYRKQYRNLPLDPDQPGLFPLDELFYGFGFFTAHARLTDNGQANVTGVEAVLQKRMSGSFHALVSAGWSRARYRDAEGVWRNRAFDNRWSFAAEGGWRAGRSWELGARWIYAGGPPHTPLDLDASQALNRAVLDAGRINDARYPDYHSLNVRLDRRFQFARSNLVAYASVWNAYGRRNIASYYWDAEERRPDVTHQWGLLPIFGFEFEF